VLKQRMGITADDIVRVQPRTTAEVRLSLFFVVATALCFAGSIS